MESAGSDVAVQICSRARAVPGPAVSKSVMTDYAAAPLRITTRSRLVKLGFVLSAILLLFGAVLAALYLNVFSSLPTFADEAGDSTIELSASLKGDSILVNVVATALPSSIWHTYDLQSATCTLGVSSQKIKLLDFAVDVEQFHIEPNTRANVELSATVTPSKSWPEEQARLDLDPKLGLASALLQVANGADLSAALVCNFDVNAKLFNTLDTGVVTIKQTFDSFDLGLIPLFSLQNTVEAVDETISVAEVIQNMYAATHFKNATSNMLTGKAIEADLAAPIEVFLHAMPLSTAALKEFTVRIEPIDVAVGVGSVNSEQTHSEWTVHAGALHLDLQTSKCIETGRVAVSAAVRSNAGESTSVLTPAAHAFSEMASAGSARFPLEFKNHQLWFEFLFGKNHATIAQFTTGGRHRRADDDDASASDDDDATTATKTTTTESTTTESTTTETKTTTSKSTTTEITTTTTTSTTTTTMGSDALCSDRGMVLDTGECDYEAIVSFLAKKISANEKKDKVEILCEMLRVGFKLEDTFDAGFDALDCDDADGETSRNEVCYDVRDAFDNGACVSAAPLASSGGGSAGSSENASESSQSSAVPRFTECNVDEFVPWTQCFEVNVDASSVVEMCITGGGCRQLGFSGQIAFETFPIHYNGEGTLNFADSEKITFEATGFNGDGPRNAATSAVVSIQTTDTDDTDDTLALSIVGTATFDNDAFPLDNLAFEWNAGVDVNLKYDKESDLKTIDLSTSFELADADGTVVSVNLQPSLDINMMKLKCSSCTLNDGSSDWETNIEVQCDNTERGMALVSAGADRGADEKKYCAGTMDLFKDRTREMKATLSRAAFDVTGDVGGVELKMEGNRKGNDMSWDSTINWNHNVDGDDDQYNADVAVRLLHEGAAGGDTFTLSASPTLDVGKSAMTLDATVNQANKDPIVVNVDMQCDGVDESMYESKVVADGVSRLHANPDSGEETKFCKGTIGVALDRESEYTFKVAKASVDVEGNGGGFGLQSTANILGDDVQLDFVVGWDALYAITKIDDLMRDRVSSSREYKGEWYEQPACDVACDGFGSCTQTVGQLGCNPVWLDGSMQSVDLHHTITFVGRSGDKFELAVQPKINSDDYSLALKGSVLNGGVTYEANVDMRCDGVEASMYPARILADGVIRTLNDPSSEEQTKVCTGSIDLMKDGSNDYVFKVKKASADLGDGGGFELQSTATILGDDVQLDFVVGWDALYAITKIEPALNDEYKGEWYEQPACGLMCVTSSGYGGLSTSTSCTQSGGSHPGSVPTGQPGCTQVWQWDDLAGIDLHHAITFVARSGQKFNLAVDPELKFLSDDDDGTMTVNVNVPASVQLDGVQYGLDALITCAADQSWTRDDGTSTAGTGSEVACSDVTMAFKQDGQVRASADLEKVVANVGWEKGSIAIKGSVFAESSSSNKMYELTEYSVKSDIQWLGDDNAFDIDNAATDNDTPFLIVNPVLIDIATAGDIPATVFGMAAQANIPSGSVKDVLRQLQLSATVNLETSANKRVHISIGDLKAITAIDSASWYGQTPADSVPADAVPGTTDAPFAAVPHGTAKTTTKHSKGDFEVYLDDVSNVAVGDTMVIGEGRKEESAVVAAVTPTASRSRRGNDNAVPGTVTLVTPLQRMHRSGTPVTFHKTVAAVVDNGSKSGVSAAAIAVPICAVLVLVAAAVLFMARKGKSGASTYAAQSNTTPSSFDNPTYEEAARASDSNA